MNKISNPIWWLVIAIVLLVIVYIIGRNSGKQTIQKANHLKTPYIKSELDPESDRVAIKRNFSNLETLIPEVNKADESKEPTN